MLDTTHQFADLDSTLASLADNKSKWARMPIKQRMQLLQDCKHTIKQQAQGWATLAARKKQIPAGSPLVGEEWISGPYALMAAMNALLTTLSELQGRKYLKHMPKRLVGEGQLAVRVLPHSIWDRLLFSGINMDIWMQKGITKDNLAEHTARAYNTPENQREGGVSLILGAGNINSIAPLDAIDKLYREHKVALVKMNPVNDYLTETLNAALKPLVDIGVLKFIRGDAQAGAYLCEHPKVDDIHITGAATTHDKIVWGDGDKTGAPKLTKPISSELGGVCPTIVVPGPWSGADLRFQAEHIATQKLHNSGFNCVACQTLILPEKWDKTEALMAALGQVMAKHAIRPLYYPGAEQRLQEFEQHSRNSRYMQRQTAAPLIMNQLDDDDWFSHNEVFAPALSTKTIAAADAETYLRQAIEFANEQLHGTLGANILIHPRTIKQIGRKRFDSIIAELKYGTIAVNAWTGLAFLAVQAPWGAFPGHTLDDVQSGIGSVHNTYMFDANERVVVEAPWRPFPRGLLSGQLTLLPRPPWFVTNQRADKIGEALVDFQYKPSWFKLPGIFYHALRG